MNAIIIMLISFAVLFIAYITYGSYLAKKWGIDTKRETPAHTMTDGVDYVPAKAPVLLGHHFASIAGAGPINGPIQAAVFGWLPVLLWILIGGIFMGAVHDFGSLFASIRHKGKSIGHVIAINIGSRGKKLFLAFAWLTLVLVVAAFTDIVASTFAGFNASGATIAANGSTATTSMLFIVISILFGVAVYRRNANLAISSIIGVACVALCIFIGLKLPIFLPKTFWYGVILVYIYIASITPVWILLQPRDYLNSFLLYFMIIGAFLGILFANPTISLPATTGFNSAIGPLFPILFTTVACGAISGFHSLVGSGTTAKQLNREKDAKMIGYGGMLIECGLAVIALIAVGSQFVNGALPVDTPPNVFANAIALFTEKLAIPYNVAFTVITLSISAFALTSLDTATRLGRYMFQEFFLPTDKEQTDVKGYVKIITNKYFSTFITVALGGVLAVAGYQNIWPLFGSANQLLAALAFVAIAVWLGNAGKKNSMLYFPMFFMLAVTLTALVLSIKTNIVKLLDPAVSTVFYREGLQIIFGALLFILAIVLVVEGMQALRKLAKKRKDLAA